MHAGAICGHAPDCSGHSPNFQDPTNHRQIPSLLRPVGHEAEEEGNKGTEANQWQ